MSLDFNITALYDLPAALPPTGQIATWTKDEYQTTVGKADISICLIIATAAFLLRMYTKIKIMKNFVFEDGVFIFAYVFYFIFSVSCYIVDRQGVFHMYNLHVRDVTFYLRWLRVTTIIYGITITGIKIVILLQYLRTFAPNKQARLTYWTCHVSIWIHLIFYTVFVSMVIFRCRPMRKAVDPILLVSPEGTCISEIHIAVGSGAFNVVSDFLLLLLPQHGIWRLRLSRNKKIGVSALFGVGIIACASAIVRLYLSARMTHNPDHIRSYIQQGLATLPECMCGMLVAALPVAPRFVQHVKTRWSRTQTSSPPQLDRSESGKNGLWQKAPERFTSERTGSESSITRTEPQTPHSMDQDYPEECEKHNEVVDKVEIHPPRCSAPSRDQESRPFSWTEAIRPAESRQKALTRATWIV